MIAGDLKLVEDWAEPLITRMRPVERRRLLLRLARGLRQRQAARIAQQVGPDGQPFEERTARRGNPRGPMFERLRKKHLRAVADADAGHVGFTGRAARIARIHNEGLQDRVAPGGPLYRYPERRLLGWSDDDRDWVLEQVQEHLAQR